MPVMVRMSACRSSSWIACSSLPAFRCRRGWPFRWSVCFPHGAEYHGVVTACEDVPCIGAVPVHVSRVESPGVLWHAECLDSPGGDAMADRADPGKDQASPRGRAADHVRPADTSATPEGRQRPPASGDASPSGVNSGRFGIPSAEAVGGAVFGGVTGGVVIGPAG